MSKIIVDKMPTAAAECPFSFNKMCGLEANGVNCDPHHCPYLKAASPVNWWKRSVQEI